MGQVYTITHEKLLEWVERLRESYDVYGPVTNNRGQSFFKQIINPRDIDMEYCSTMLAPRGYIYPSRQKLFDIDRQAGEYKAGEKAEGRAKLIFAIHPCDMQAICVLDRTFLGAFKDVHYKKAREETVTVVLNCNGACDEGFCASMGTGPFLQLKEGYDIELTAKWNEYIVEAGSERGKSIIEMIAGRKEAGEEELAKKKQIEQKAKESFTKSIDTAGLVELLLRNLEHPVYERTAESRCLGCTNCTMVCPTCYCYNMVDETAYDLKTTSRARHWDSCQELNFAKVHEGNFRSSRKARLRQFVTHKLATWVEQYGCFGCVGCGRCMTWCPTKIDLTDMAKEIQEDAVAGKIK